MIVLGISALYHDSAACIVKDGEIIAAAQEERFSRLLHSTLEKDKKRICEKLFFLALCMRNFPEAERILKTMSDNTEYKKCWQEIEALLDNIKGTLAGKRQRHIIIYWLDALDYAEGAKLEYLRQQRENSLYFYNAFTVTFGTNPTCKTIFCGTRQVDDLGYRIRYFSDIPQIDEVEHIGVDNSPLLRDIIAQDYDFSVLGSYLSKSFDKKYNHDVWSTREPPLFGSTLESDGSNHAKRETNCLSGSCFNGNPRTMP